MWLNISQYDLYILHYTYFQLSFLIIVTLYLAMATFYLNRNFKSHNVTILQFDMMYHNFNFFSLNS